MAADNLQTVNLESDNFDFGEVKGPEPEVKKKDNKILIIVVVVAVILLCCCLVAVLLGVWLWNNGDALLEDLGVVSQISPAFLSFL